MRSEGEEGNKEDVSDESSRWSWNSRSSSDLSSHAQVDCSIDSGVKSKPPLNVDDDASKFVEKGSEFEMMKERFTMLLLGEDMSGRGKGVCSASAISNAITNLYATVFGQMWRLEPLLPEKKSMWQREMGWLLCVSDYIVEMIPAWHKLPDGTSVEIMSSRQRLDLLDNLPVLRILDNMLLSAALELANRVESAIYAWIKNNKGLVVQRAENLLQSIRQRYPGITQTALDSCKIRCNKDVGKSILESYSRVLESLAFSIVARIQDLLCVDDITNKHNRTAYTTSSLPWDQKIDR